MIEGKEDSRKSEMSSWILLCHLPSADDDYVQLLPKLEPTPIVESVKVDKSTKAQLQILVTVGSKT